jgi:hypothetical protein
MGEQQLYLPSGSGLCRTWRATRPFALSQKRSFLIQIADAVQNMPFPHGLPSQNSISKSMCHNLTNQMSFDTLLTYADH